MACNAQCNQVLLEIASGMSSIPLVVNLEIRHLSTALACPAIPLENLLLQPLVAFASQPLGGVFLKGTFHCRQALNWRKNSCFCSPGKNLKKFFIEFNRISGLPLSRFAPARKSAQIISRQ